MSTAAGDIVLIHHKGHAVTYARVEQITPDVKPGWWQVRLLFLQVPSQEVTWILREEYIDGREFTMGGDPMRLEKLAPAAGAAAGGEPTRPAPDAPGGGGGKVLSLAQRKGKPN